MPGQVLRLAGLCHVTLYNTPQHHHISTSTVQSVVGLADILTEHAKAAFGLLGADDAIECAKAILNWIRKDNLQTFTARDCLSKIKGRWPKMSLVDPGLTVLEERGYIMPHERKKLSKGRPSRAFLVNPHLFGVKE